MKLRKSLFMCATLVVAVCAYRCSDDKLEDMEPAEVQLTDLEKIKRLGLSTDGIQQEGENYIVEGDICITPEFLNEQDFSNLKQARSKNIVSCQNAKNIKVKIDYRKGSRPYNQSVAAIKNWNNLEGDNINFEIVTSNPDITIKSVNINPLFYAKDKKVSGQNLEIGRYKASFTLGRAGFPSGGKPFETISYNDNVVKLVLNSIAKFERKRIKEARSKNLKTINNMPIDEWSVKKDYPIIYEWLHRITYDNGIATIMHELGHCVGLWHTNWKELYMIGSKKGIYIPGTAELDEESLMNGNSGLKLKPTFTSNDKKAVQALYKDMDALCKTYGN